VVVVERSTAGPRLLITQPTAEADSVGPINRRADAAVYLRPARGGLMVGGFETGPLPVDPRHQPASFTNDDVPPDPACGGGATTEPGPVFAA
jgi:hypothetical protein